MTDIYDQATAIEERERESAIAAQRKRTKKQAGYSHCEDCSEEIPEARRKASPGCRRCIECQTIFERVGA